MICLSKKNSGRLLIFQSTMLAVFILATNLDLSAQMDTMSMDTTSQEVSVFEAPPSLVLSCSNRNYDTVVSWLYQYEVRDSCENQEVSNDFDGNLPSICGDSIAVVFQYSSSCQEIRDTSFLSLINDSINSGFQSCFGVLEFDLSNSCDSVIYFPLPEAHDCFGPLPIEQIPNAEDVLIRPGEKFPIDTTEIVYTTIDACSKRDTCAFQIAVRSAVQPSTIFCPSYTAEVCLESNQCSYNGDSRIFPISSDISCSNTGLEYEITLPDGVVVESMSNGDDDGLPDNFPFPIGTSKICYQLESTNLDPLNNSCCIDLVVRDCTPPTVICPTPTTISCELSGPSNPYEEWLDLTIIDDDCTENPILRTLTVDSLNQCMTSEPSPLFLIAIDSDGNTDACVTSFVLIDTIAPQLTRSFIPQDTIACDTATLQENLDAWIANNGGFTEDDVKEDCGTIQFNYISQNTEFVTLDFCPIIGFYEATFFITDNCGNASNQIKSRLYIADEQAPSIEAPEPLTTDFNNPSLRTVVDAWIDEFVGIDSCSEVTISNNLESLPTQIVGDSTTIPITFVALDECDNQSSVRSTLTLVKEKKSTISAPDRLDIECPVLTDTIDMWLASYSVDTMRCDTFAVSTNIQDQTINNCGSVSTVTWLLTDSCGAFSTASSQLIVELDNQPPFVTYCPEDTTIFLDDGVCEMEVAIPTPTAEDCNSVSLRLHRFEINSVETEFTNILPIGQTFVNYQLLDSCRNAIECFFNINIESNTPELCDTNQETFTVRGQVNSHDGSLFELSADVILEDTQSGSMRTTQLQNGSYSFSNVIGDRDYSINISKKDDVDDGISTLDILLIQQYILDLSDFDEAEQVIAADVNGDGKVSTLDIVEIRKLLLMLSTTFPNDNNWKFLSSIDQNDPLSSPQQILLPNLNSNKTNQNFEVLKIGDVNNSFE